MNQTGKRAGACGWVAAASITAIGLLSHSMPAMASHVGETLTADQSLVGASDQLLTSLRQWESLAPAARSARTAALVEAAQRRQQQLVLLLQKNPRVAAARFMPAALRSRLPAQAAGFVEQEVELGGTLFAEVADHFTTGASRTEFKFQAAAGGAALNVYLADPSRSESDLLKWAGKKVTLGAVRVGEHLAIVDHKRVQPIALGSTSGGGDTTLATTSAVLGDQKTLSIIVNFSDAAATCTTSDLSGRLFGATGSTVNNNYRESSRGLVGFSGQVVGPYTINYSAAGTCNYLGWASAAEAAAKAAGIDPAAYTRVNYVTPTNASCGWTGLAYMPGRQSWVQACNVTGAFSHELGHNLSLNHAATPTFEYGDSSDPMGGAQMVGHNGANRTMAGWMPAGTVQDVTNGGAYALATLSNNTTATSPQVLRLRKADTSEYYYVSLRQAVNLDQFLATKYLNTLSVHRTSGALPSRTVLMQNLAAGQSFVDTINGITIANQGVSNGTATVGVSIGSATCQRNAPTISVSPASQSGAPGASLTYSAVVTNTSTAACGTSNFNLAQVLPTGFSGTSALQTLSIAPGASASTNWTVTSTSSATNATYDLQASVADTATGLTSSTHASYVVFASATCTRVAPSVVVSPTSQSGSAGANLPFTVTVTNRDSSGCGTSSFSLGQALPAGFTGQLGTGTVSLAPSASANSTWNVLAGTSVGAGTYALSAKATAAATSSTVSTTASGVIVATDATPPSLAITSPSNGAVLAGNRGVAITAAAGDASGIQAVEFQVDGKLLVRDTGSPYAASWNPRKAAKGSHTILVRAIDMAGNKTEQTIAVTLQ